MPNVSCSATGKSTKMSLNIDNFCPVQLGEKNGHVD